MASIIDNRFFNSIRDVPMSTLNGPSPTRIAPINFGFGQDNWDRRTNIWQMTSGTYEYIAGSDKLRGGSYVPADAEVKPDRRPASPNRDNKTSVTDVSKMVDKLPVNDDHNIMLATDFTMLPSSRPSRPIGPPVSPTRPKNNNGTLDTGATGITVRSLGQASLLPGSAPDIEPTKLGSSSSTMAKHHGLTIGRSFRQFNVEDAEEFVPSYLRDHSRVSYRASDMKGFGVQPQYDVSAAPSGMNFNTDLSLSSARSRPQTHSGQMPTRAFGDVSRDQVPTEETNYDTYQPRSAAMPSYASLEGFQNWSVDQPNRRISNLRPEVASYEPSNRATNGMSHYNTGRYDSNDAVTAYAQGQNQHSSMMNANAYETNTAIQAFNGRYQSPYGPKASVDGKQYKHRNPAEFAPRHQPGPRQSSIPRPKGAGNAAISFPPATSQYYGGTEYDHAPDAQRFLQFEENYVIDPVTGCVNYLPEGGFVVEPELEQKNGPRSAFLEEFRMHHKNRKYELKDIYGHIIEFSGDQNGSRFIQTKIEQANSDEKDQIFAELRTDARQLMSDVFGNYVIQKMFDYGNQSQKKILAGLMQGSIVMLSQQPYGCRSVQKALEHILTDQQVALIKEIEGSVMTIVESQHGNHVIQKAIECIPGEHTQFIVDALKGQIVRMSKHIYGCRIVQRILEYGSPTVKRSILDELQHAVPSLIADQFGNYVIQCIIRKCDGIDRYRVVEHVKHQVLFFSTHKFASNVVEKALVFAEENQRAEMMRTLITPSPEHAMKSPVPYLLRDQYGNYVMQTVLKTIQGPAKRALADEVRFYLNSIAKTNRGKQVTAMADTINAITAGHSPSSVSTGPHTPRTPTSPHLGGRIGSPITTAMEVIPPGYGSRQPHHNTMQFKSVVA